MEELTGVTDLEAIENSVQASAAIDELRRVHEERRPHSAKQRRFIDDLIKKAEVSEEEAAALVDLETLEELTGGREGTASELIDRLQERAKKSFSRGDAPPVNRP